MSLHDVTPRAEPGAAPDPDRGSARAGGRERAQQLLQPATRALRRIPRPWRLPLATFVVCQAIFLFWWAAFYPALMSYDSVAYVIQVTVGPWVDNYSILYNALVWLTLHLTGGLAALALMQTVVMSASFAYTVVAFRRLGIPGRWTAIAAVILTALPPTGTFVIFIWKDVGFVICLYLLVPTVAHLVSLRDLPDWRHDRRVNRLLVALGLELLGILLFRLNGFLIVAIAVLVLLIVLPGIRIRLIAVTAGRRVRRRVPDVPRVSGGGRAEAARLGCLRHPVLRCRGCLRRTASQFHARPTCGSWPVRLRWPRGRKRRTATTRTGRPSSWTRARDPSR